MTSSVDVYRFTHRNWHCMVRKIPFGNWNGYVLIPHGHWINDAFRSYDALSREVEVHGGITYWGRDGVGFDTMHDGDEMVMPDGFVIPGRKWTRDDVEKETRTLADQLIDLKKKGE